MGNPYLVRSIVLFWLCYLCCHIFPQCMHVDTVVPLWHVVANILQANGKTTGALWHPNSLDGWCFQLDRESKKVVKSVICCGHRQSFQRHRAVFLPTAISVLNNSIQPKKRRKICDSRTYCSCLFDKKPSSGEMRSFCVPLDQLLKLFLKHVSQKGFLYYLFYLAYSYNSFIDL